MKERWKRDSGETTTVARWVRVFCCLQFPEHLFESCRANLVEKLGTCSCSILFFPFLWHIASGNPDNLDETKWEDCIQKEAFWKVEWKSNRTGRVPGIQKLRSILGSTLSFTQPESSNSSWKLCQCFKESQILVRLESKLFNRDVSICLQTQIIFCDTAFVM